MLQTTSVTLLERLRDREDAEAWRCFVDRYTPLVRTWLACHLTQPSDLDDTTQQVMTILVGKLPEFHHAGRPGSFRAWLRGITVNCLRAFWRSRPPAGFDSDSVLLQLEDPGSHLSRRWDREHDHFVIRQAMGTIEAEFKPTTWQAFRRVALDEAPPEEVAAELGLTVNAVFIAKSRVLRRLREEIEGFD